MNEKETQLFLALWIQAKGGWEYRIDNPKHHSGQKHIHIRRKRGLKGEYSWNIDGSRHDEHKYPSNEKMIKRAKEIASEKLNIPVDVLQLITSLSAKQPAIVIIDDSQIVIYEKNVSSDSPILLLACDEWIIIVGIGEDDENA